MRLRLSCLLSVTHRKLGFALFFKFRVSKRMKGCLVNHVLQLANDRGKSDAEDNATVCAPIAACKDLLLHTTFGIMMAGATGLKGAGQ